MTILVSCYVDNYTFSNTCIPCTFTIYDKTCHNLDSHWGKADDGHLKMADTELGYTQYSLLK